MTFATSGPQQSTLARWAGFTALCIGMFMAVLDIQIVLTSLGVLEEALKIGADRMSWVQTAYLIAEVVAIPLTGLLMRVFSLRWLVAGAIVLFCLASAGCAASAGFGPLVAFRVMQGLAGGVLIPVVFAAVFLLFRPGPEQTIATTMGGMLAVLAPALGPIAGGVITETLSWHWLFLINLVPGAITLCAVIFFLPREKPELRLLRSLDLVSLALIAGSLAALEIGLKEAPDRGWASLPVLGLLALSALLIGLAIRRPKPVVDFGLFGNRNLAFGSAISFVLGTGLYGSVYLLPFFLAFVRHMGPIEIGLVVLVTGAAQLVSAPVSVWLDRKYGVKVLTVIGFSAFAIGLAMSGFETRDSGFHELFWAQVVRGASIGLCILPATRLALGLLPLDTVSEASGLYNLCRNLGGAIGIALVDTVIFSRSADFSDQLTDLLKVRPEAAAELLRIGVDELPDPDDPLGLLGIMDMLQETSLTWAINEAWLMLAGLTAFALILVALIGPIRVPESHVALRKGAKF